MDWEGLLTSIDELVFEQTEKHLNDLQLAILKGVLNGQKYIEIAQRYGCTTGHAKDEVYELWQVLSKVLGEELNKSNFCATVERLGFANLIGNHVRVDSINLCNNPETTELENNNGANTQSNHKKTTSYQSTIENVLHATKLKTVSKLIKLGLTAQQIAEAVDLPLNEIQQLME